jgi:hypothetical protein
MVIWSAAWTSSSRMPFRGQAHRWAWVVKGTIANLSSDSPKVVPCLSTTPTIR